MCPPISLVARTITKSFLSVSFQSQFVTFTFSIASINQVRALSWGYNFPLDRREDGKEPGMK